MANGLPTRAKVGIPGKSVNISPATYFIGTRMEKAGMLRRGQALMLAATLPIKPDPKPTKGMRK